MLEFVITRHLSFILPCLLSVALFSCSSSKKASPNAILDVEFNSLEYEIIQKSDEGLIEYLIFFSEENEYQNFRNEVRRLNLLVPTTIQGITYLGGEEAVHEYGNKGTNGVMIVKSSNTFKTLFNTLETFGIPFSTELYESNNFYFEDSFPELIGGLRGLTEEIEYPKRATKIHGRVVVKFIVSREGKVIDSEVSEPVHRLLDEEALRVVNNARFIPAIQEGKPAEVQYSLPVNFRSR